LHELDFLMVIIGSVITGTLLDILSIGYNC
jgi:hypothetical protein